MMHAIFVLYNEVPPDFQNPLRRLVMSACVCGSRRLSVPDSSSQPPSMMNSVPVTYWFCCQDCMHAESISSHRDEAEDALGIVDRRAWPSERNGPLGSELVVVLL